MEFEQLGDPLLRPHLPIVGSSSESQIDLKDDSSVNSNKEDAKDQVEQMALKGSSAEKKF